MTSKLVSNIRKQAKPFYNLNVVKIEPLGENENVVVRLITKENYSFVCRITSESHRSEKEILDELKVLTILKKYGANVVSVVDSLQGSMLTKVLVRGHNHYVTVFGFEDGQTVSLLKSRSTEKLFFERGSSMGKIHKIIEKNAYELSHLARLQRNEEIIFLKTDRLLREDENKQTIIDTIKTIFDQIKTIPKSFETFGITHTDMRPRNFKYQGGKIIHFDFDDICYHWFAYDIAVSALHSAEEYKSVSERTLFLVFFLTHLIKGYISQKKLLLEEAENLINLMHLRLVYAYVDYYKRLKIKKKDDGREKMLNRYSYIEDFDRFVDTKLIKHHILDLI